VHDLGELAQGSDGRGWLYAARVASPAHEVPGQRVGAWRLGGFRKPLPRITWSVILSWVIKSFRDTGTEDLFDGRDTKQARKSCPSDLVRVARRKLDQLNQAEVLGDLRAPPSNRLEKLKGEREGQYSIRINDQWRVCFQWTESGAEDVEIVDYH
jgi:toxin HigB-1